MRKMRRTRKLHNNKRLSRNRIYIFTSGGLLTALLLVLVLVSLENPSGGTGSLPTKTASTLLPQAAPAKQNPRPSGEKPLTFYETLTREESEGDSLGVFETKAFDPLTPPTDSKQGAGYSEEGYTIQVAALANKATAENLAKRLRQRGFASHILPLSVPNRETLFRVRIGGFHSQAEAEKWVSHLKQEEGLSPFITRNKG